MRHDAGLEPVFAEQLGEHARRQFVERPAPGNAQHRRLRLPFRRQPVVSDLLSRRQRVR